MTSDKSSIVDKCLKEIREKTIDSYIDSLNIIEFDEKTRDFLIRPGLRTVSHLNRIHMIGQIIKTYGFIGRASVVTCCFKVTYEGTNSIYANLHCDYRNPKVPDYKFIGLGPTFRSNDGEYRNRILPWSTVMDIRDQCPDIYDMVEELVLRDINNKQIKFSVEFFGSDEYDSEIRTLGNTINNIRLPIKLFIICWLYDIFNIHYKFSENHINPGYVKIIYREPYISLFKKILKKHGTDYYFKMRNIFVEYYSILNNGELGLISNPRMGQKLFPLTAFEAIKTDDITFSVWREIYVSAMVTNLVINVISPSFPIFNNWFYVQNAHAGLFDNKAMHDKYAHSNIAEEVSKQLQDVDRNNYTKRGPISGKFFKLSNTIRKSILYAESDIKLTDLAVCVTGEYVGNTLRDLPTLAVSEQHREWNIGLILTDNQVFAKHMFEFIYSFYCMNTKLGIIHGDLHMNNATINYFYKIIKNGQETVLNPHIAYIIENNIYVFPHLGMFSTIIDFSRAILGDFRRLEHEFSAKYAELYFADQYDRVLQTIYQYFPTIMERYKNNIESLLTNNFPLLFKILSVVDSYVIMTNISSMFTSASSTNNKIRLPEESKKLLDKIALLAERLFSDHLRDAIEGKLTQPEDIPWPNLQIIQEIFSDYIMTSDKMIPEKINVIEVFNSNNDVVYEIEDYDTWGPLLSPDIIIEAAKKYGLPYTDGIRDWIKFKSVDQTEDIDRITAKYETKEQEMLEYESWMLL